MPVEVPGVVGVTATGDLSLKSFYSSYGISTADVAAPGGDSILQVTPGGAERAGAVDLPGRPTVPRPVVDPAAQPTATCRARRWPARTSPASPP